MPGAQGVPMIGPVLPSVGVAPAEPGRLRLVPYHLWTNRGPASMRVWLPVTSHAE
jgi:uncharacterized protein